MTKTQFYTGLAILMAIVANAWLSAPASAQEIPAMLKEVQHLNYAIHFKPEQGRHDYWKVATTQGDCEDIALAKREALIKQGWDAEDLKILILITRDGTGHATLYVKSLDLILDNEQMFKDRPVAWPTYRSATGSKSYCFAQNLTEGEMPASKRCKPPVTQVAGAQR